MFFLNTICRRSLSLEASQEVRSAGAAKALGWTVEKNELPLQRPSYSITPIYRQPSSLTDIVLAAASGNEEKAVFTAWQPSAPMLSLPAASAK